MNPKLLIEYLATKVTKSLYNTFYGGFVYFRQTPVRDKKNIWYITENEYPYELYPPFVSGSFYILSSKTVKLFYKTSKRIRLFKFDDVYLGILAYSLNITPIMIDRIYFYKINYDQKNYTNEVISVHKILGKELLDKWNNIDTSKIFNPDYFKNIIELNKKQYTNNNK